MLLADSSSTLSLIACAAPSSAADILFRRSSATLDIGFVAADADALLIISSAGTMFCFIFVMPQF